MKIGTFTLIIIVNLLAGTFLVFWYPQLMVSPGKLLEGHQELTTDCFSCHTVFTGSSPEKCISCHSVDEIGLFTTKGEKILKTKGRINVSFHHDLNEQDCVACHSDHQGMKVYRSIRHFSHELLNQSVQNNCATCHQKPDDSLHRKTEGNCGQCHSQTEWIPAAFDHRKYFRFDSDHEAECVTCHVNNDYNQYSCYECHEHSPSKIREEHLEEGIYDYENCTECHRSGDEDEAKYLWRSKKGKSHKEFDRKKHKEHDDDDDDEDDD